MYNITILQYYSILFRYSMRMQYIVQGTVYSIGYYFWSYSVFSTVSSSHDTAVNMCTEITLCIKKCGILVEALESFSLVYTATVRSAPTPLSSWNRNRTTQSSFRTPGATGWDALECELLFQNNHFRNAPSHTGGRVNSGPLHEKLQLLTVHRADLEETGPPVGYANYTAVLKKTMKEMESQLVSGGSTSITTTYR